MNAAELREKSTDELNQREREPGEQPFKLRFQKVTGGGSLENPMKIRSVRREIARIKTLLQEKTKA
jgi:large subunit ribosomal protein L29